MGTLISRIIVITVLCTVTGPAFAQEGVPRSPSGLGLTADETKELQEQLQLLRETVETANVARAEEAKAEHANVQVKQTLANAADKAVSLVDDMFQRVIGSVEKIAPTVWRIMVKQQYVKAVSGLIMPLGWLSAMLLYYFLFARRKFAPQVTFERGAHWENSSFWFGYAIPLFIGTIAFLSLFGGITDGVKYAINPEYYAVRDLMVIMTDPTHLPE